MEKLMLLGATGSVGASVLNVIRSYPGKFKLYGVSGNRRLDRLASVVEEFSPTYVWLPRDDKSFMERFPATYFLTGDKGLEEMASMSECDTVVNCISGIAGLAPTLSAIRANKKLLTANKESLVSAGGIVLDELYKSKTQMIPLDSEHSAIFQLLGGVKRHFVDSVTLTASGGPFREREIDASIEIGDVLDHPTWNMGPFITVNSATMINKGFEVIEAHVLFGLPYEKIEVVIHPQSVVHGMVTLRDGTILMAAYPSDMRYPVASAMFYPEVPEAKFPKLELPGQRFKFDPPDTEKFPLLPLAYACGQAGGVMPAVLNAANEIVVEKFLDGFVPFWNIPQYIAQVIEESESVSNPGLEEILIADKKARIRALELVTADL